MLLHDPCSNTYHNEDSHLITFHNHPIEKYFLWNRIFYFFSEFPKQKTWYPYFYLVFNKSPKHVRIPFACITRYMLCSFLVTSQACHSWKMSWKILFELRISILLLFIRKVMSFRIIVLSSVYHILFLQIIAFLS